MIAPTVDPLLYPSEKAHTKAVLEFERLTQHPLGSDLLYYPKNMVWMGRWKS
ncbi:TPA: bacteriocin immunity protein [Pseudomonas putida]